MYEQLSESDDSFYLRVPFLVCMCARIIRTIHIPPTHGRPYRLRKRHLPIAIAACDGVENKGEVRSRQGWVLRECFLDVRSVQRHEDDDNSGIYCLT